MEAKAFEDETNVAQLPALESIADQARLLADLIGRRVDSRLARDPVTLRADLITLRHVATTFGGLISDPL